MFTSYPKSFAVVEGDLSAEASKTSPYGAWHIEFSWGDRTRCYGSKTEARALIKRAIQEHKNQS